MMKKLLFSALLLAAALLMASAALAEFTVLDHGMYIFPDGKGVEVMVVYELQSNNPGAVYTPGTHAHVVLLDRSGNVLASQNVRYDVDPAYIAPGGKAFVTTRFRYADTGLTSASQIADYQLNLTVNPESYVKVDTALSASSSSFTLSRSFLGFAGSRTLKAEATLVNQTGAMVSDFRAIFVFRDRNGHLLFAHEETYFQPVPAGGSITVEADAIGSFYAELLHSAGDGVTLEVIPYATSH